MPESLEKRIARQEAKLAADKKKLRARERAAKRREAEAKRKADTRRKVILGGYVLELIKRGDTRALEILERCIEVRTNEGEQQLFEGFLESQRAAITQSGEQESPPK